MNIQFMRMRGSVVRPLWFRKTWPVPYYSLIAISFCVFSALAYGTDFKDKEEKKIPQTVWEQLYSSESEELELKNAAAGNEDTLWLLVGKRPRGELSGVQTISLWQIDSKGTQLSQTDISPFLDKKSGQISQVGSYGIITTKAGNPVITIPSGAGEYIFVQLNSKSKKIISKSTLDKSGGIYNISKVIPSQGTNNIGMAVGRVGSRGMLLYIDALGQLMGKIELADPDMQIVYDAVQFNDETILLVGGRSIGKNEMGLWVAKISNNGKVLAKTTFEGRYAGVSHDQAGQNFAVVYDRVTPTSWDVGLRGFTGSLEHSWKTDLLSNIRAVEPFKIAPLPNNRGFIVVGAGTHNLLWVSKVGENGNVVWEVENRDSRMLQENIWNYQLFPAREGYFIPYTDMVVKVRQDGKLEQRQVIKLVKFSGN